MSAEKRVDTCGLKVLRVLNPMSAYAVQGLGFRDHIHGLHGAERYTAGLAVLNMSVFVIGGIEVPWGASGNHGLLM